MARFAFKSARISLPYGECVVAQVGLIDSREQHVDRVYADALPPNTSPPELRRTRRRSQPRRKQARDLVSRVQMIRRCAIPEPQVADHGCKGWQPLMNAQALTVRREPICVSNRHTGRISARQTVVCAQQGRKSARRSRTFGLPDSANCGLSERRHGAAASDAAVLK